MATLNVSGGFEQDWPWLAAVPVQGSGARGRNAGSSICRQNSPPSGVGCFTNLPHTLTDSIRTLTQTHVQPPPPR